MKLALDTLINLPGVDRVVVCTRDGLVYQHGGTRGPSAELLAAELTSVHLALSSALKPLSSTALHRFSFSTDTHEVFALNAERLLLAVAVRIDSTARPVQVELARIATQLERVPMAAVAGSH